ncbi:MAG: B12-binding domain-containing radical SAM protein [Magnetococcales bacterium]|nr:B12-binding domain-containing radical SAM protein [Magnetococcales bacterium]NGZ26568.1 B12-binding domain-containing radical SAM protein [Magnetococcales bacterium]
MELTLLTYTSGDMGQMPIGPLVLAQLARQRGWSVQVRDLPPLQEEEELIHQLANCQVVGFSTISNTFHRSIHLAEKIKSFHPHITIVMGGPQATATARPLMEFCQAVDVVFLGEAEESWQAFLDGSPLNTIPGLFFRQEGHIQETPSSPLLSDLDRSPMPAFDLYPPSRSGLSIPIETGRGCPFLCTYCSTNRYFSRRFRAKSPQRILAEMDWLNQLYGVWSFDLIQDNFNTDPKKILAFCDAIQAHPRRYVWNISARPDKVDETLASRLKNAGCEGIYFGIETGSQRMQKLVRKNLRMDRAIQNILTANQMGFATTVSFIVGFPQETRQDLYETLLLYTQFAALPHNLTQLHLLSPLQGSQLMMIDHTPLAFDGMPTDFNESEDGWQDHELVLFQQHPQLFPHMSYYLGAEVARDRYLFIVYLARLGLNYFHNFMSMVSRHQSEAWVNFLLDTPIPENMVNDRNFPLPPNKWIPIAHALLHQFALGVSKDGLPWLEVLGFDHAYSEASHLPDRSMTTVHLPRKLVGRHIHRILPETFIQWNDAVPFMIQKNQRNQVIVTHVLTQEEITSRILELCAPCGECCLDEQGFHCSYEEWLSIARFMKSHGQEIPTSLPVAWQGSHTVAHTRFLVQTGEGHSTFHNSQQEALQVVGQQGWLRSVCAHLRAESHGMVCAMEQNKPLECLAFPFSLVADPQQPDHWNLEEGKMFYAIQSKCPLAKTLKRDHAFNHGYRQRVNHLIAMHQQQRHGKTTEDQSCSL